MYVVPINNVQLYCTTMSGILEATNGCQGDSLHLKSSVNR